MDRRPAGDPVRVCACGCGQPLVGRRRGALYVSKTHGQRAYRRRLAAELEAAGLPAALSLQTARATSTTTNGNGDRRRGRQRAGSRRLTPGQVRYGHAKLLAALEDDYATLGVDDPAARARELLWSLSTYRQREAIRG